jgi:hypothetical protein
MEQISSWEANRFSASQEIPCILCNPKLNIAFITARHLSLSWAQRASPRPWPCKIFRNMINFYGERFLPPPQPLTWRTTPCRLSTTAYSVYSQLSSISGGRSSIRNLRTRHAVVTGTHLSRDGDPLITWRGPTYQVTGSHLSRDRDPLTTWQGPTYHVTGTPLSRQTHESSSVNRC